MHDFPPSLLFARCSATVLPLLYTFFLCSYQYECLLASNDIPILGAQQLLMRPSSIHCDISASNEGRGEEREGGNFEFGREIQEVSVSTYQVTQMP